MMNDIFGESNDLPPPLDAISSAGGTEGDIEEQDLEVNLFSSSYPGGGANSKLYKPFAQATKVQPTDFVYREENSRAAPRKGTEPKAFLTIGETKQERVEYVGRSKQPATAPHHNSNQRQSLSASAKKYDRQTPMYSAPLLRNKSADSRTVSANHKGRRSVRSTPGYTPLPVAPPQAPPTRENTYLHHPFKQDLNEYNTQTSYNSPRQLSSIEELLAHLAYHNMPVSSEISRYLRRPVSPSEDMKQATILATMEIGRIINQRTKSAKGGLVHQPRLLKARLKPLNTVKTNGPSIYQCAGIQSGGGRPGPSPMKAKQRQQFDDIIQKSGAIKDLSLSQRSHRTGSNKNSHNGSANSSRQRPESASSKREPTPSPYSSQTRLDKIVTDERQENATPQVENRGIGAESRPESATQSEGSKEGQQTRSVSAVLIQTSRDVTPDGRRKSAQRTIPGRGNTFLTDAASETGSATTPKHWQQSGCRDFEENKKRRDDNDGPPPHGGKSTGKPPSHPVPVSRANKTQETSHSSRHSQHNERRGTQNRDNTTTNVRGNRDSDKLQGKNRAHTATGSMNTDQESGKKWSSAVTELETGSTFITAGFVTLESMIKEARSMLKHSYSLSDLEEACWEPGLSSPRSVEVLHKRVNFAEQMQQTHFYEQTEPAAPANDLDMKELQIVPYMDSASAGYKAFDSSSDLVNINSTEPHMTRPENSNQGSPSCVDDIYKELAARDSSHGIHGQLSEYLTSKPFTRNIYPPEVKSFDLHLSETLSLPPALPVDESLPPSENDLDPKLPPSPVESSVGSMISESDVTDNQRSFLECMIELLTDEEVKNRRNEACDDAHVEREPAMPAVIEGTSKPVTRKVHPSVAVPIAELPPCCFRVNATPPAGHVFYFCYNADMNAKRLASVLGRPVGTKLWALLFGFQLVFNKKGVDAEAGLFPNIEFNPYTSTEGSVYTVTNWELSTLDCCYGYPEHHSRMLVPVWVCNSQQPDCYSIAQYCVPAMVYIAQDRWLHTSVDEPCSEDYSLRQCLHGSEQLTDSYKQHLNDMLVKCSA